MHPKGLKGLGVAAPGLPHAPANDSSVGPVELERDTQRGRLVASEIQRLERMAVEFGRRLEKESQICVGL